MNLDVWVWLVCQERIDGVGSDSSCSSGWKKNWREWIGGNLLLDTSIYVLGVQVLNMKMVFNITVH